MIIKGIGRIMIEASEKDIADYISYKRNSPNDDLKKFVADFEIVLKNCKEDEKQDLYLFMLNEILKLDNNTIDKYIQNENEISKLDIKVPLVNFIDNEGLKKLNNEINKRDRKKLKLVHNCLP